MPGILTELKRRNVFRVAVAYVVIGWLLVQVLELLVDAFEAPGWVLKIVIAVVAIGFLPALALSWVYEMTPEGIKRESNVDRSSSITHHTARKLDLVTITAVVIGAAFVGWTQLRDPSPTVITSADTSADTGMTTPAQATLSVPDMASVAVLPFVNMSANADNQYFADGLTETLLHMLAQVRELKVAARTSSFAFKGRDTDIREIASTLNVSHVLEGSVQRAGERVRITAQLIRASDGFHVWSENYDRTLEDVFQIQDEIATDVRSSLSSSLLGTETGDAIQGVATENIEAYDLYLQALAEKTKGSYGALQEAERLLKKALAKDADFLEASTELALVLWSQAETGLIERDVALKQADALLAQVLKRRPEDVRARTLQILLSASRLFSSGDIEGGFAEIDNLARLAEQAPSEPLPREILAMVYTRSGRLAEARAQLGVLLKLDPLNPLHHKVLGDIYLEQELLDDARDAFARSLELEPEQPNVHGSLARLAQNTGDVVGYVRSFEQAMVVDPEDHEIPAIIASRLYEYGLIDIGDRFKAKTAAMAPASPASRKIELDRAIAVGDHSTSTRLARKMLEDNIDDRQGGWFAAALELFRSAAREDDYAGALAFMDKHYPGYTDASRRDLPPAALFSRSIALGAAKAVMSPKEFSTFLQTHKDFLINTVGIDLDTDPFLTSLLLVAEGKQEAAIKALVNDVFTQPESRYFYVADAFWHPHLAPLKDDPRIARALAHYEQEAQANKQKLLDYFNSKGR